MTIDFAEYIKHIAYQRELAAVASATVVETDQVYYKSESFQITGSSMTIDAPKAVRLGEEAEAVIVFKNPLQENLTGLQLTLHSGFPSRPSVVERFPK